MKILANISKYSLFIIGLYLVLLPILFLSSSLTLDYTIDTSHLNFILMVSAVAILGFYIFNKFSRFLTIRWQKISTLQIILAIVYSALFAIPEEIIFRGIIQHSLQGLTDNIFLLVLASSAIFGLAHLPNGARGINIKKWNWQFCAITFLAGLPLSIIFASTDSLFFSTILHAIFLILFSLFTEPAQTTSA